MSGRGGGGDARGRATIDAAVAADDATAVSADTAITAVTAVTAVRDEVIPFSARAIGARAFA